MSLARIQRKPKGNVSRAVVGPERDLHMALEDARYCLECDIVKLRQIQKQTLDALTTLVELLEAYAPSWYRLEHHELADAALAIKDQRRVS